MTKQPLTPSFTVTAQNSSGNYTELVLEPLEHGYGHTLGNSLRRVLLESLQGAAITSVKIAGVNHQFSTLKGLKQDIVEFILNLKQVRLNYTGQDPVTAKIKASGKTTVTAKDIILPANVTVANPSLKLAQLTDAKAKLNAELTIESGIGYSMAEERQTTTVGVIPIDALFTPITRVAYQVEATRVGRHTDFDKLILKIQTDGSLKPREALNQAAKILVSYFQQIYNPIKVKAVKQPESSNLIDSEIYRLTVEELDLPTRIANALRKGGYKTVKDLQAATEADLKKVKNLGEKSIQAVIKVLKKKGVELAAS